MKHCPSCNRTYADDAFTFCLDDGSLLSAPYDPDQTIRIPASSANKLSPTEIIPPAALPISNEVELTIYFPGTSVLINSKVEVYLDEKYVGIGSLRKGINLITKTSVGTHTLKLKYAVLTKMLYDLEFASGGKYKAYLNWGSWSGFEEKINLQQERT